jgi:GDP-4-dehydro-6-deoxy-D-mannose reductase
MRLLVTGADGFVGRYLVSAARAAGHQLVAAILPDSVVPAGWEAAGTRPGVEVVPADFRKREDVARLAASDCDAVVHLAAIASGTAARADPDEANLVNGVMTAYFGGELSRRQPPPRFLFVSTAEVYGPGHDGPIPETAPRNPRSPYAVSKAGAEIPLELLWERGGLPVIIARAFPHTGPGQSAAYVLPALAERLKEARRLGAAEVRTGSLAAVRDFLDVRDVVQAYLLLLERGVPGAVYNVASGQGRRLRDCFDMLAELTGVVSRAVEDAGLLRPDDIPVLIGDATKLRHTTGWSPRIPFESTLKDLVDAQAD